MGLYDAPSLNKLKVGTFKGIDVSVPEDQQQPYRAADALNMIPDASGEVRKRPGVQYDDYGFAILSPNGNYYATAVEFYVTPIEFAIYKYDDGAFGVACLHPGLSRYTKSIDSLREKPVVISYGDSKLVFMKKGSKAVFNNNETVWEAFEAAVMVITSDECIVYTNDKKKYVYSAANQVWLGDTIRWDDSKLTRPEIFKGSIAGGGGTPHQQINLLNPWVTESFCVTAPDGENTFHLQEQARAAEKVSTRYTGDQVQGEFKVEVLHAVEEQEGGENEKTTVLRWLSRDLVDEDGYRDSSNRLFLSKEGNEHCYYYDGKGELKEEIDVNYSTDFGNISSTPKPGEDNVRITHLRADFSERFIELCQCVCGSTYGVGGYKDRLFLGGPGNTVYYSEMEDPFYIGALNYVHTEEGSKVMALDGTAGTLSIITDKGIVLLSGQASTPDEDSYAADATFVVSNTIPAPAPIGYGNTAVLGGEIVYLSKEGIVAIAAKDNYAERYAEYRSALIDRKMMKDGPERILNFGRYLLIFCKNGICWLLDENQPNKDGNKPYAAHQYEGYRMDGFDGKAVYIENGVLKLVRGHKEYSGLVENQVYAWKDGKSPSDYHDERDENYTKEPIKAHWETPWIFGSTFYKNKIFMRLGVLLGELTDITTGQTVEANTGVLVEGKKNDEDWKVFMDEEIVSRTFSFSRIDFRYLTFRGVAEMPALTRKIKVKKAKRFKLRFSNNTIDQPFILQEYGLDYVQED